MAVLEVNLLQCIISKTNEVFFFLPKKQEGNEKYRNSSKFSKKICLPIFFRGALTSEKLIFISSQIEWDIIVVTVFLSILNQLE